MNVQVTIKIDRDAVRELAETFREVIYGASNSTPQTSGQAQGSVMQTASQAVAPVPAAPPLQQDQPVPVAPVPQGQQAYSAQIAQKTQLPVQAVTGGSGLQQGIPTTAVPQDYTQDQMAVAFTGLIDTGRRDAVTRILGDFGVQALTQIPKERYPELALKLREAGANI